MTTVTCTRCGGELELDEELEKELKSEARGALPPLTHERCPDDLAELTDYSVEIIVRRGPAPEAGPDDEAVVVWFKGETSAPSFVQAVPALGRILGRRWEAIIEQAHVVDSD